MKKQINIVLVILLTVLLSSCFTSQEEVLDAKKEMGIVTNNTNTQDVNKEDKKVVSSS